MNLNFLGRVSRLAAIGAILLGSAACINVNEELGENLIPTDQKWDVFPQDPAPLTQIRLQMADSLSGYSSSRFTFGAVKDDILGTTVKGASFTLVPLADSIDLGTNTRVNGFHFTAIRDTLSTVYDSQQRIIQNVFVSELKAPLDSNILYAGAFMNDEVSEKYLNLSERITEGIPVYDGGDSLSFDFSKEFAESMVERLKTADLDSMALYLEKIPGIYITTDTPVGYGGRINMFELGLKYDSNYGYITGNYAELKIKADYGERKNVDTSFVFFFGPGDFLKNLDDNAEITQYSFNTSIHETFTEYNNEGVVAGKDIYVEGGTGVKPVVKAKEIREIVEGQMTAAGIQDITEAVINKATIILPYNVNGDYEALDKFPGILSPTVRLKSSTGNYVTYAGLTDSSIATENQGNINRSLSLYCPDISHHVQEIMKVKKDENFEKNIEKYDIWFLIMHEEVYEKESNNSYMDSYYQNLMYNSYYNNMMYDPYGYGGYGYGGYGYGYGGYGYGGYGGYGYNNYYNYMMMAAYASAGSSSTESSVELDKDRYYRCTLNGPEFSDEISELPRLKVTFSAPKSAE